MKSVRIHPRLRLLLSRLSSLLLLLQRSPVIQLIFPEAKILGGSAIADTATFAIATVVGLGAYDTVAGASTITQTSPSQGSMSVSATTGNNLVFVVVYADSQSHTPKSWSIVNSNGTPATLPNGLVHQNVTNNKVDSITGIPTQPGTFTLKFKAWENSGYSGNVVTSGLFTLTVTGTAIAPEIAVEQPEGVTNIPDAGTKDFGSVDAGSNTSLIFTIKNTGNANLTGLAITKDGTNMADFTVTANPVAPVSGPSGKTTFTVRFTPSSPGTKTAAIHFANNDSNENPFDITLTGTGNAIEPAAIVADPGSTIINYGDTATLSVVASGTAPLTYQWYQGTSGTTTTPVGTNSESFTTPGLTASTSYWVKVTNSANPSGAYSGTATVTTQPLYDLWIFTNGSAVPSNQRGTLDTPQKDGVNNLLKFAFNMDPNKVDARRLTVRAGDLAGLPGMARVNGKLRLEYVRRKASTNPGITYAPQCTSDLAAWTPLSAAETVTPIGTTVWERVVVDGPAGGTTCIGRVVVQQVP